VNRTANRSFLTLGYILFKFNRFKKGKTMARPIESTPILRNKDADRLLREAESYQVITPEKRQELDHCAAISRKFSTRTCSLLPQNK